MHKAKLTPIILLLLAAFAVAEESAAAEPPADPETRWHDAYVLEVIEGKIPEAAKEYLALLRVPGLSAELARECRFRFAVCCAGLFSKSYIRSRSSGE